MIRRLYELLTGTPWTTTRSAAAEFGPPPAVRYPELADYSDAELLARDRDALLEEIRTTRGLSRALNRAGQRRREGIR